MTYLLSALCIFFAITTAFFAYTSFKFGKMLLQVQESIEESLQLIEEKVTSVSRILEIPLFFDSPEIKRVHNDLRDCRDIIVKVANSFSRIEETEDEEKKQ